MGNVLLTFWLRKGQNYDLFKKQNKLNEKLINLHVS